MPAAHRLRTACDSCHRLKVRCSGSRPCVACTASDGSCVYSLANPLGRPVGSRNKRQRASLRDSNEKRLATASRRVRDAERPQNIPVTSSWPADASTLVGSSEESMPRLGGSGTLVLADSHSAPLNTRALESSVMLARDGWNPGFPPQSPPPSTAPSSGAPEDSYRHIPMFNSLQLEPQSRDLFTHPTASSDPFDAFKGLLGTEANATSNANLREALPRQARCACLQRQITLLIDLKRSEPRRPEAKTDLSSVLANVHEAHKTWLDLTRCAGCVRGDDQEVLLVALMSVRLVLSQLHRVHSDGDNGLRSGTAGREPDNAVPVLVGGFEVTGDDRLVLLHVLWSIKVRRVETVLESISDAFKRRRASRADVIGRGGGTWEGDLLVSESEEVIGRLTHLAKSLRAGNAQD